jgi:parallel beta-helix repeat protein
MAVRVYEQSSGTVEGNDLSGNASGALSVSDDSGSNLIRNNNKT